MTHKLGRMARAVAVGLFILSAVGACSVTQHDAPGPNATADPAGNSPSAVAAALKSYFASATSDQIGGAFPDKATEDTFAPVLQKIDPAASVVPTKKAVTDLALLKIADPKAALALAVDESRIQISGQKATVPASALSVTSRGTEVVNNGALAAEMTNLVFRNENWVITFPPSVNSSSASPEPSASTK